MGRECGASCNSGGSKGNGLGRRCGGECRRIICKSLLITLLLFRGETYLHVADHLQRQSLYVGCSRRFGILLSILYSSTHRSRPLYVVTSSISGMKLTKASRIIVYHLVGEMFLGAWAAYTSQIMQLPDVTDTIPVVDALPEISRIIFAHVSPSDVYDHAGLSSFFFNNSLSVSVIREDCVSY